MAYRTQHSLIWSCEVQAYKHGNELQQLVPSDDEAGLVRAQRQLPKTLRSLQDCGLCVLLVRPAIVASSERAVECMQHFTKSAVTFIKPVLLGKGLELLRLCDTPQMPRGHLARRLLLGILERGHPVRDDLADVPEASSTKNASQSTASASRAVRRAMLSVDVLQVPPQLGEARVLRGSWSRLQLI
jgi:hypothetical protein